MKLRTSQFVLLALLATSTEARGKNNHLKGDLVGLGSGSLKWDYDNEKFIDHDSYLHDVKNEILDEEEYDIGTKILDQRVNKNNNIKPNPQPQQNNIKKQIKAPKKSDKMKFQ